MKIVIIACKMVETRLMPNKVLISNLWPYSNIANCILGNRLCKIQSMQKALSHSACHTYPHTYTYMHACTLTNRSTCGYQNCQTFQPLATESGEKLPTMQLILLVAWPLTQVSTLTHTHKHIRQLKYLMHTHTHICLYVLDVRLAVQYFVANSQPAVVACSQLLVAISALYALDYMILSWNVHVLRWHTHTQKGIYIYQYLVIQGLSTGGRWRWHFLDGIGRAVR